MRYCLLLGALALLVATPALAAEPGGCDKFKWPIERERAALTAPDRLGLIPGADISKPLSAAAPFVIQISGMKEDAIALAILPVE